MLLKKSYPALEYAVFAEEDKGKFLLHGLPDELLKELEDFAKRNAIVVVENAGEKKYLCCLKCLMAHALKISEKINLDKGRIELLKGMFDGELIGHNGYYLDKGELIKI